MCDMLSQSRCRRAFEEAGLVHGNVTKLGCIAGFRFFRSERKQAVLTRSGE